MDWRQIFRIFQQNDQFIQKLSETRPIRRAAQYTVYWFLRGQQKMKGLDMNSTSLTLLQRITNFSKTFQHEVKEGLKKLQGK